MSARLRKGEVVAQHPSERELSMPLINPVCLFTASAWIEAFNVVAQMATEFGIACGPDQDILITVEDLYFSKWFKKGEFRDFEKVKELLAPFAKVFESLKEEWHSDRKEPNLHLKLFDAEVEGRFYQFKGAICFSIGGAVATDSGGISTGKFWRPAVEWNMKAGEFLNFLSAIESALMGCGDTSHCRAFMRVQFPNIGRGYSIQVRAYLEDILLNDMRRSAEKSIDVEFIVHAPVLESTISWAE